MPEPKTKCGTCEQTDDHPKHQIGNVAIAQADGQLYFHPHDFAHNRSIYYHFDCDSEWHNKVLEREPHPDVEAQAVQQAHTDTFAKTIALAKSGVHGDELRARIQGGNF